MQEILPDNNIKTEKMLMANPPNILKRAKALRNADNAVSIHITNLILTYYMHANHNNLATYNTIMVQNNIILLHWMRHFRYSLHS